MSGAPATRPARRVSAAPALFLVIGLVLISTGRSLANGFAFDDIPVIVDNAQVHTLAPPWVYAQQSYWPPKNLGDAYRPWSVWMLAIQWAVSGGAPWLFHLVNLALTAATSVLVYCFAALVLPPLGAVVAGGLFAVHPVHVEATGNVVGQAELWMALFTVAACLLYFRARRAGSLGPGTRVTLAGLLVLAAAAKEQGIVLPALLALLEWLAAPAGRNRWREVVGLFGLLAVVAVGFVIARFLILGDLGGGPPAAGLQGLGFGDRALVMMPIVLHWIRLLVWPRHLEAQYSPPAYGGPPEWSLPAIAGLAALAGVLALFVWAVRHRPIVALGLGWIGITLAIVTNIPFPTGILLAERTMFLPSAGIVLVGGALAAEGFVRWPRLRPAIIAAIVGLFAAGAARSWSRQAVWRDSATLFAQTVADGPRSYRGFRMYGWEMVRRGNLPRGRDLYAKAGELYQGDVRVFEELGQLHRRLGDCPGAVAILGGALTRFPDATVLRSRLFECLMTLGRTAEAARVAEDGVRRGMSEFAAPLARARAAPALPAASPPGS